MKFINNFWLKANKNDIDVFVEKIGEGTPDVLSSEKIKNKDKPIKLKVVSHGEFYDFYYLTHNSGWGKLCGDVDAHYLSTASSFGFTGTTIGKYAVRR
ncbi:MAG: hypothetical protein JXR50_09115 [Prolixibacteraceae bacterium]|nr:hypothetical protein [Prolixibacteraceae bacterium]MBN2649886.1 hypothetical protein [Prolixibacteraceae bacterium]